MIVQLNVIIDSCQRMEEKYAAEIAKVHPALQPSAINLLHYRALRQHDIRKLQNKLGHLGLSRLGKAESHVMASLKALKAILRGFTEPRQIVLPRTAISIKKGNRLLDQHAHQLFGYRSRARKVRIMVTQPSEASYNRRLVFKMMEKGMNTARINCAHDGPEEWGKMIENIKTACTELEKDCKVCMDLGGPKIRTGSMLPGPKVVKFSPVRDDLGRTIEPSQVVLWPQEQPVPPTLERYLPLPGGFLAQLQPADELHFSDARNSKRMLKVTGYTSGQWLAHCHDTAYLLTGTRLHLNRETAEQVATMGDIPPLDQFITLHTNDYLTVLREPVEGQPARYNEDGQLLQEAFVSCTSQEVFRHVKAGEAVLFDDGKIKGEIAEATNDFFRVKVLYAKEGGAKLKADKGINFPDSHLKISGLTDKDRQDLSFVARHADVVNMSFVNRAADVQELIAQLGKLDPQQRTGIILKIETQAGFNNLTDILLAGMQMPVVGVMIARGDLAIECGWEHMARIQEEILSVCQAAHVPVVWATQVLENLAKKGIPSRAEITDAAMAQRAECVMLNKGPHITTAIKMLDYILINMQDYQNKKAPMLPILALSGKHMEEEDTVAHV